MTRKKKSRKPGRGSSGQLKQESATEFDVDKRIRKKKGNKPGSRHQVKESAEGQQNQGNKDPRVGSKKPVSLGVPIKAKVNKPKPVKPSTLPKIVAVSSTEAASKELWQELEQIEENPQLQAIIEKMDAEQALTAEEVDLYNELMDRHEALSEQLGIDDVPEADGDIDNTDEKPLSEDELWNKFNDDQFDVE